MTASDVAEARRILEEVFRIYEGNQTDRLADVFTDDVVFRYPGGFEIVGISDFAPILRRFSDTYSDVDHEILTLLRDQDVVAVELLTTARHTGVATTSSGDIAPTGRRIIWESAGLLWLAGGRIARWHVYQDQLTHLTQLQESSEATV